ncbi:MAG: hypothetical protein GEV09_26645, partial [Pseudonocardiaceae bacterium]|nr:hypothetical protein [Pseudonocardiaceae bacterium]
MLSVLAPPDHPESDQRDTYPQHGLGGEAQLADRGGPELKQERPSRAEGITPAKTYNRPLIRCTAGSADDVRQDLQSAGLLFFAFAGYARIATMGEEVRDPQRVIPRALGVRTHVCSLPGNGQEPPRRPPRNTAHTVIDSCLNRLQLDSRSSWSFSIVIT